jgi:hypothetical protein
LDSILSDSLLGNYPVSQIRLHHPSGQERTNISLNPKHLMQAHMSDDEHFPSNSCDVLWLQTILRKPEKYLLASALL